MTIRELAAYVYGLTPMHPGKWRVIHTLLPRHRSSEWHITRINSAQMAVDTGSVMGEHLFYGRAHERWETEQARRIIRSGDVVLDIGANIGYYSVLFSQLVGSGQVYAFEPSTRNLPVLRENLRRNRIENVQVVEAALSDRRGVANLGGNTLDTLRIGDDYPGESVKLETLDEWAEAADLRRLDFVKADIEGHEIPMLRGGSNTIRRFRPAMLLEACSSNQEECGWSLEQLHSEIVSLGYDVFRIHRRRLVPWAGHPELNSFGVLSWPAGRNHRPS